MFCQEIELHRVLKIVIEPLQQGSIAQESDLLVLHSSSKSYENRTRLIILHLKENTHCQQAVVLSLVEKQLYKNRVRDVRDLALYIRVSIQLSHV